MVYFYHAGIPDHVIKPTKALSVRATPFKDEKKSAACVSTESGRCEEEHTDEEEHTNEEDNVVGSLGSLRVTTRANIPYNIEGYSRNAMLMMSGAAKFDRICGIEYKMIGVNQTFANLRFEITQHEDLTDEQIDQKCQEFFERDFTDYGCVAVVLFKPDGSKVKDYVVVRHWTTNGNPTLRGKPKLYINESNHDVFRRPHFSPFYSVPITDDHPDVLCLHIFLSFPSFMPQPLMILCNKLSAMPHEHLLAIIKETIEDTKPRLRDLAHFASTQDRKLFLSRNSDLEHN